MNGFAGFVGATPDPQAWSKMVSEYQTWTDGLIRFACAAPALAVRRDLAVVATARIDARDDLLRRFDAEDRGELGALSGAELILRCFERWGAACLDYLIGDFSFAVWNRAESSVFCARDQFGVQPFFYSTTGGSFAFSNTLEALRTDQELDPGAIADFLLFGCYQDPAATAFAHIRRLPPGHAVLWQSGSAEVRRYWMLPTDASTRFRRSADYVDGFRELLERAVSDRIDPVSTAVLMSGGLDSTMVAATAAAKAANVKSFAIVYDSLIPDPERHFAQVTADALNIPLEFLVADRYKLFENTPSTPEPVDEPLAAVLTDHLLQVKDYSTVALSGIGGDPLLFPSPHYASHCLKDGHWGELAIGMLRVVRLRRQIPRVGLRGTVLSGLGLRKNPRSIFPPWLNPEIVQQLLLRERWARFQTTPVPKVRHDRPEAYENLADPQWSRIFDTYDPAVTGIAVEVRHPLFDLRLVKYCLGLPPIPWCVDKTLARVAMKDRLPDAVRMRPKSFSADPVAPRLAASPFLDSWKAAPELPSFVDQSRIPILTAAGTEWDPHLRPYALNEWLIHLTRNRG